LEAESGEWNLSVPLEEQDAAVPDSRKKARAFLRLGLVFEGGLGLAGWLVGRMIGLDTLRLASWTTADILWGTAATVPMIAVFAACLHSRFEPLNRIRRFLEEQLRPAIQESRWYELALLAIAAGFGEEIFFRGLVQGAIAWATGTAVAVVVASLIFGLAHPITRMYVVVAGVLGLYLGALYAQSGSILRVSVAHAAYDFIALVWFLKTRPACVEPYAAGLADTVVLPLRSQPADFQPSEPTHFGCTDDPIETERSASGGDVAPLDSTNGDTSNLSTR
jgi:membrane protease YdiL (CAAX protease family)